LLYSGFIGGGGGGGGGETNAPPTAAFTFSCTDLTCSFNGSSSSDADGTISSYQWTFGDGSSGTGATPSRTYAAAGTYTVTLTVTDDDGATGGTSQSVTVTAPSSGITLAVTVSKTRGVSSARLTWSGATSSAEVYRNNAPLATVTGTSYTDTIGRGGGTVTYRVCNAGTSTCSSNVSVTY
jgi:PKD repeat protein